MHLIGSAVVKVEGVQHLELLVLIVAHWIHWVFGLGEVHIMTLQGQPGTTYCYRLTRKNKIDSLQNKRVQCRLFNSNMSRSRNCPSIADEDIHFHFKSQCPFIVCRVFVISVSDQNNMD